MIDEKKMRNNFAPLLSKSIKSTIMTLSINSDCRNIQELILAICNYPNETALCKGDDPLAHIWFMIRAELDTQYERYSDSITKKGKK